MESKTKNREKAIRYYYRHQELCRLRSRKTYWSNREKCLLENKKWCQENRDKRKIHSRRYYEKHKKEIINRSKIYRKNNPEVNRRAVKKWRENNLEKARKLVSDWSKKNRIKRNYNRAQRIYQKKANGYEKISKKQWDDICEIFGNKCFYCKKKKKLTMDHYIPLKKGGSHTFENLVPACSSCNCQKGASTPQEWRARQKRLVNV